MEVEITATVTGQNSTTDSSTSRKGGNEPKLNLFAGKTGGMKLTEFLDRFEDHCFLNKVSNDKKWATLKSFTTDEARAHLSTIIFAPDFSPEDKYRQFVQALRNKYGLPPESAFIALCNRTFKEGKENEDTYASELVSCANVAFDGVAGMTSEIKSLLVALYFWKGMPNNAVTRQTRTQWKSGERTLERAVTLCRNIFTPVDVEHAFVGDDSWKNWEDKKVRKEISKKFSPCCTECRGHGHLYW
jgi:hypothetical protein